MNVDQLVLLTADRIIQSLAYLLKMAYTLISLVQFSFSLFQFAIAIIDDNTGASQLVSGSKVLLLQELISVFRGWWASWFDGHDIGDCQVAESHHCFQTHKTGKVQAVSRPPQAPRSSRSDSLASYQVCLFKFIKISFILSCLYVTVHWHALHPFEIFFT